MIFIAHRGNLNGPNKLEENKPYYIQKAIDLGFDVEVDVWSLDNGNRLLLGHDKPMWSIDVDFLSRTGIWCHAKTIKTLYDLMKHNMVCFFHDKDKVALTSNGYIWTKPGMCLTEKSICVLPEIYMMDDLSIPCGICSDYINDYKNKIK